MSIRDFFGWTSGLSTDAPVWFIAYLLARQMYPEDVVMVTAAAVVSFAAHAIISFGYWLSYGDDE